MKYTWIRVAASTLLFANTVLSAVRPVLSPTIDITSIENVIPTTNVTLSYANANETDAVPSVNVTLAMSAPSVLLEAIASVSVVDCSPTSVDVTFTNAIAFAEARATWPTDGNFTLITNHMGDCDVELERGFFLVTGLTWSNTTLNVRAVSINQDIAAVADVAEISFGGLEATPLGKRALVLDPSFTLPVNYSFPRNTTLYSSAPYLTIAADSADFGAQLTVSGYLKYSFLQFKLNQLYFDIDAGFDASVTLSASIGAGYNSTFIYAAPELSYQFVNIPGVLTLGPALTFSVGAEVASSAAVNLETTFSVGIADGNVHVDALNKSASSTSGWKPTYYIGSNISSNANVDINPYVSVTVELGIDILGGLVDLSTGLTAKPKFTNEFSLTDVAGFNTTAIKGLNSEGTCSQGLAVESDFELEVDLFVTQFYRTTLWDYKVDVADVCYTYQNSTTGLV
ncbi:hypothetical protein K504DRAFT_440914 [Pleomassaria siparia CBS 279.74]|uniref:DUF7029 domain-containing protein n=1 Tax=Pleomassaria siparia CBS 279.74 TaxID=1314801 RepID=A0A6G1JWZ9_9PLEO|nr:hypothetical protein K504DRAFT_440914 [Pleomassaria siparia CBS 279.74]